ncbi:hypothetical protein C7M22_03571 [Bacillus velezensis]|nr:hypothetical protein BVH55_09880 [Bacillus velezensis]QHK65613.1 hypothetical protein C7M22_03571 [Bacillus velezensis]QHL98653.1 hypothetical protein C7M25_02879 [Bacillus velezensis]GLZ63281.1 hypothetical protein Bamy02_03340 [Bacillus amyloliquefaciens]
MNKKHGLYCMGTLVNTYDDAIEAHNDAVYAQEESGVPHEVREIDEVADLNEFKFKLSEEAIAVVSNTVYTARMNHNTEQFEITDTTTDSTLTYTKSDIDKYIKNNVLVLV